MNDGLFSQNFSQKVNRRSNSLHSPIAIYLGTLLRLKPTPLKSIMIRSKMRRKQVRIAVPANDNLNGGPCGRLTASDILHISKRKSPHQKKTQIFLIACTVIGALLIQLFLFHNFKSSANRQEHKKRRLCFKTVSNSGGFGNRIGPLMCAAGLAKSADDARLIVLWNAANEGTPGNRIPPRVRTGRGGYSFDALQKIANWPFEWVTENKNDTSREISFYAPNMQADVERWRRYFVKVNSTVVSDYAQKERWFEEQQDCFNVPNLHKSPIDTNDYTPEPCWTRYQAFGASDPQFSYLQGTFGNVSKDDYVDAVIESSRLITPKIDMCLPPKESYVVLHARRGDRSKTEIVENIMERIEGLKDIAPLHIISENPQVKHNLTEAAVARNISLINPSCTPQDLEKRHNLHGKTLATMQDYFLMSQSAGVISDFERDQSSFSTTAALGNGLPMLYPGVQQRHGMFNLRKSGNDEQPMRNVYFLQDIEQFFQNVTLLVNAAKTK